MGATRGARRTSGAGGPDTRGLGLRFFGPKIVVSGQAKHEEAMSGARRIRGEQEDETVTLGRTFARAADGANAFSKLSRYETAIERQLYEAPESPRRPWPWTLMFRESQKATAEIWLCFVILCREGWYDAARTEFWRNLGSGLA
jgi:hypothetical protein